MQGSLQALGVNLDHVVCSAMSRRNSSLSGTEAPCAYYHHLPFATETKPFFNYVGPVLVSMQPDTETVVDKGLHGIRVQEIALMGRARGTVMPDGKQQQSGESAFTERACGTGYAIGVDSPTPVERIVVIAAIKRGESNAGFGKVEDVELLARL